MSDNEFKLQLGDSISELEKQAEKIEKLASNCRAVRFKLMVECLQLKSELHDLQASDNTDCSDKVAETRVTETSTNLDSVDTNVRLDLSVPSSSLHRNEELEEEEEEIDEEE